MTASTSIHPLDYGVAIELLMPMPTATTRPLPAGATATPWRAYLRRAEWLLVEQVLLRGESAWTVFIRAAEVSSVEEACNSAAAGNITDFYRALLAPPESGDDARYETLSALVIPRTHPPFVVACSLRTRLMLLELWHFVGLRSRGAAIEQTMGTAAAATKHGGAATLNISTHDGGRTTAANGVAAPRIFAPSFAAPSIDLHPDDVYFTLDEDWECYRTWRALQEDMRDASDAQHDKVRFRYVLNAVASLSHETCNAHAVRTAHHVERRGYSGIGETLGMPRESEREPLHLT